MTDQEQLLEQARSTNPRLVIDRYGMEAIQATARMIRETRERHPPGATCECEAMDALKVVLAADNQLREQRDELDRQLRDAREQIDTLRYNLNNVQETLLATKPQCDLDCSVCREGLDI